MISSDESDFRGINASIIFTKTLSIFFSNAKHWHSYTSNVRRPANINSESP